MSPESHTGVVVLNPVSGDANHEDQVRRLADEHGYAVHETTEERTGVSVAYDVADDVDLVLACGGDGTINEVVTGLYAAGVLDEVDLAVVPGGTGNNFAGNVGVEDIEHAFEVAESGERRHLDLGRAEVAEDLAPPGPATDWLFVNSCICGLTARASGNTTAESKSRLGVLSYVVETLRAAREFDGVPLSVDPVDDDDWHGEALMLLVGNARRFPAEGRTQANVEDGMFDVTVVEEQPTVDLAGEAVVSRLFGDDTSYLQRFRSREITVGAASETTFSLDGEMLDASRIDMRTLPSAMTVCVGDAYEPAPE